MSSIGSAYFAVPYLPHLLDVVRVDLYTVSLLPFDTLVLRLHPLQQLRNDSVQLVLHLNAEQWLVSQLEFGQLRDNGAYFGVPYGVALSHLVVAFRLTLLDHILVICLTLLELRLVGILQSQ